MGWEKLIWSIGWFCQLRFLNFCSFWSFDCSMDWRHTLYWGRAKVQKYYSLYLLLLWMNLSYGEASLKDIWEFRHVTDMESVGWLCHVPQENHPGASMWATTRTRLSTNSVLQTVSILITILLWQKYITLTKTGTFVCTLCIVIQCLAWIAAISEANIWASGLQKKQVCLYHFRFPIRLAVP